MIKLIKENTYLIFAILLLMIVIWQLPQALDKDCEIQKTKYESWKNNESVLKNK